MIRGVAMKPVHSIIIPVYNEEAVILKKYDVKYIALSKARKVVKYLLKQDSIKTLYEDEDTILFERVYTLKKVSKKG